MKKNHKQKKEVLWIKEKALRIALKELEETNRKKDEDLKEIDRIAKMLIRRDFELTELEEKRKEELLEMDKTAKILIRRDFELTKTREKRELEFQELKKSRETLKKMLKEIEYARAKTEEEKNKTLTIINNLTDGLLVFDKENRLLLINPQAEKFLRVKTKNVINNSLSMLSKIVSFKPIISLYKRKDKKIFRQEINLKKDLILEITIIPLTKEKSDAWKFIILHDITREKLIEKTKSEFVSLAAHQLRTPLSILRWILKMFLDKELGKTTKEQKEFLLDAYNSNQRMIGLVNDLLDVARIEEGKYIYNMALTDIKALIQSVISSYKSFIKEKKLEIEFKNLINKSLKVLIDAEKINIVIDNIFENAIRYSPPRSKVTVFLKCDKKEIEVSVKDSGMGIPSGQQKRVFKKFFRGVNVLKKETRGTGLGLFICKNIIEAHEGKIWFESKENKGTIFYFTIPIKKRLKKLIHN